jgi:hypothetical protein
MVKEERADVVRQAMFGWATLRASLLHPRY